MGKLSYLSVFAILMGITSATFALTPRTGEYTCNRLGEKKYECLRIIRDKYVDEWASGALDRYKSIEHTIAGMRVIVDQRFQEEAVRACDRFTDEIPTNRCLYAIRGCTYEIDEVIECDRHETLDGTVDCFRFYCGSKGAPTLEVSAR